MKIIAFPLIVYIVFLFCKNLTALAAEEEYCSPHGSSARVSKIGGIIHVRLTKNGVNFDLSSSSTHPTQIMEGSTAAKENQNYFNGSSLLNPHDEMTSGNGYSFLTRGSVNYVMTVMEYKTKNGEKLLLLKETGTNYENAAPQFIGSKSQCTKNMINKRSP